MNSRLENFLKEILRACSQISGFMTEITLEEFKCNIMLQQAIAMNFILIGEAVNRISEKFPDFVFQNPQIKWDNIRGLRNRAVHGYFELDQDLVYRYATISIVLLETQIKEFGVSI